jgi:galactokinase
MSESPTGTESTAHATNSAAELSQAARRRWGREPRIFRAPGRVNLIGEHTDYNDGFVFPAAIHFSTWTAAVPRDDSKLVVHSENFSQSRTFLLDAAPPHAQHDWSDYVMGVALMLKQAGAPIGGAELLIHGEVPIGSGLSSSAAIETSVAFALLALYPAPLDRTQIALLCQKAENEYVGMRCGIMDQFVSGHAQVGHALLLDCRTLEFDLVPLPEGASLAICNSMVHHSLAASEYNHRREECETAVRILARRLPEIRALRDVSLEQLEQNRSELPEVIHRRARHVITENGRTQEAARALRSGDLFRFGALMGESHRSLRDDYEVSCRELDILVDIAAKLPGIYGSRMTGGGFGGCTVSLVRNAELDHFRTEIARHYREATQLEPAIYITEPAEGAEEVSPPFSV